MKKYYRVIIPPIAKESLREIFEYIKTDSPSAAIKVQKKLIEVAKSLKNLPERFSKEHFLSEKKGNYRSVVQWHYKIIYKVSENEVTIIRFMHTSKDPKGIEKIE
ncbi:MAG: type II toxin-antitoxin system RelE/ParE family toxin [Cyclobacteriaceae bacterium]|jgi:addiction module RelE/StbE family toxin|nr:type II toxin-antitoxin system RelE/ParE family toxin [Flammeovirgaceae bacterium]